jgi:hypothetical protein
MPPSMSELPSESLSRHARDYGAFVLAASLLVASFWIFDLPKIVRIGPLTRITPATISTFGFLAGLAFLFLVWRHATPAGQRTSRTGTLASVLVVLAAFWVLGSATSRWISLIVINGIDVNRADMLVQIQAAVERFVSGKNPYFVYYVPWELPLSYGPWLWMWYVIPQVLNADLRLAPMFGQVFIASLLAIGAALEARHDRYFSAIVAFTFLRNPLFERFLLVGHTPAYWPLIALFALTTSGRRYRTAAAVLGLLLGARTPMIALVPTCVILVWRNDRRAIVPTAALLVFVVAATFGPFLLWDWRTLVYGMYGNYVRVIQDFVWPQTNWMSSTLGLTRLLVASGWSQFVGLAQAGALTLTYGLTWWRLRPGESAAPWLCLALTVFCMTTLWPVWYVFLDVFVLGLAFFVAEHVQELRSAPWKSMAGTTILAASVIVGTLLINPGVFYTIEAGRSPRWHLRSGFGVDREEAGRGFAWATRDRVHLRLPRGLRTDATIQIECEPFIVEGAPAQTIGVSLNGTPIGLATLRSGWQTVTFPTRARAWRIGHNDVTLFFKYALPSESGEVRAARLGHISIAH